MKKQNLRKIGLSIMIIGSFLTFGGYFKMWLAYIGIIVLVAGFFITSKSEKKSKKTKEQKSKTFNHFYFKM